MSVKVILMMAQSADGIIARHNRHFPDWTCSADKKLFKKVTEQAGVIIMGSRTYEAIGKPLSNRLNIVYTRHPERFEPHERVRFTTLAPNLLLEQLEREGHKEVVLTGGAEINSLFAAADLIDELLLTVSPLLFGQGLSLFAEPVDIKLSLMDTTMLDEHTLNLHYRVLRTRA